MPNDFPFVVPLHASYCAILGSLMAQWGVFDAELTDTFYWLRMNPEIASIHKDLPKRFDQRMDALKEAARASFKSAPTLAEKIVSIASEAKQLSSTRDLLAHGRWQILKDRVGVYSVEKGKNETFTRLKLKKVRNRIAAAHGNLLIFCGRYSPWATEKFLTPTEMRALQEHGRHCRPPPYTFRPKE